MSDNAYIRPNLSRLVFGLAVVAAGVLFTLHNLHFDVDTVLLYWPLVIAAIGFAHVVQSRTFPGYAWGLFLVFVGLWLTAQFHGWVDIDIFEFSPLLLVLLGASIIWRGCCGRTVPADAANDGNAFIKGTAVLAGFERTSTSSDFRGGDLVAVMGGCKLDLRQATIANTQAVLDLTVVMGGVELRIPETWTVDAQVLPLMGGVTNQTRTVPGGTPQRLLVRGTAVMGGVEIKN